uniref:Uncharacterized protein n=1 Tax=Salix viminalis TaxID=40686 RepID=A0A6N2M588_SALVM
MMLRETAPTKILEIVVMLRTKNWSMIKYPTRTNAANSSPSGTPAGGDVPFPSMNNHQLQMSVEPEKNLNLNFQCGRMKKAQKRQKRILDGEKEKGIGLADMAANLSKILLNCGT